MQIERSDLSINNIQKRDGRIVPFEQGKITNAIHKASIAVGQDDRALAESLSDRVVEKLSLKFKDMTPNVEDVQDIVEQALIESGLAKIAKAYILYREKHKQIRESRSLLMDSEVEARLTPNAIAVLERRYLKKDNLGRIIETPTMMFRRVASNVALADAFYGSEEDVKKAEEDFYRIMTNLWFIPNSPTMMNAGKELQQLSACFVIPVGDSMESIFDAIKHQALIHKSGGGTGFSFSRIRPRGDFVSSTKGVASGPISFMTVFDAATDTIKQGGTRRGANMGILRVDHPDILDFITAKDDLSKLNNFNISVSVTEKFMDVLEKDEEFELINPRTKEVTSKVRARYVFDLIVKHAWQTGEPGVVFIDRMNEHPTHPTPKVGEIESTNPCGEQPLLPYESCNLGSVNLARVVKDGQIDWDLLRKVVHVSIHFLDNIIDMNKYPVKEIEQITRYGNRKIGLGVMGFADMLIQLDIPYNSKTATAIAEEVMKFIKEEADKASVELAKKRDAFPNFPGSTYDVPNGLRVRNATRTTVAPTGTISIIAGCSSGIEPIFGVCYIRNVMDNTELVEVNPLFERIARERGFYSEQLMRRIAESGSIQHIEEVPEEVRRIFITTHDIKPEDHVRIQAAFQKYTDNAVSKTVNFPKNATVEDVRTVYLLAYKLGCKGVTIYRDGCRSEQVLNIGKVNRKVETPVTDQTGYQGGCPNCSN